MNKTLVVVPWHDPGQLHKFQQEWNTKISDPLVFQEDKHGDGCAATKNAGIKAAYDSGAEVICVLDDDCYPEFDFHNPTISRFILEHTRALEPQQVQRVVSTTDPNSRGTPYKNTTMLMPVAASMGFWTQHPDFDAISALHLGETADVLFNRRTIFGDYFPFCGMNFAFHRDWIDEAMLIEAPRWDDIWMGWIWEKIAYEKGFCFNLQGPTVRHSRQSNIWRNLREEAKYMEDNETLWSKIAGTPHGLSAHSLRKLLINPILSRKEN